MAIKTYPFKPDYIVPPGETLSEVIRYLNLSVPELASRTELTEMIINDIINGKQHITTEIANKLELVTNVPATLWNNLEKAYRCYTHEKMPPG